MPNLANCHAIGLDSIILADRLSPERGMVRVFVARPEHSLWRNDPEGAGMFSIGLHAHHCDITMVPLFGNTANVFIGDGTTHALAPFRYSSAITGDGVGFTKTGSAENWPLRREPLLAEKSLRASALHSVYVPLVETAAWLIIEGRENPHHDSTTWSDVNLEKARFDMLYRPMTAERLAEDMALLASNGAVRPVPRRRFATMQDAAFDEALASYVAHFHEHGAEGHLA